MKKSVSLLANLLLFGAPFWVAPPVAAEEMISGIPTDMTAYCHPEFPISEDSFSWQSPVLDLLTATIVDMESRCDYGPPGSVEGSSPPLTEEFQESSEKTNTPEPFRQS
ncbi:MAG TPA: hypothetical protein VE131_05855 [Terriglobales bacterium]|nr:hypothetical protein [Terriglobales bacterium]